MATLIISTLMIIIAVSASNMLLQDSHMIRRLRYSMQAEYLAEAGISDALATLANNGFSAKDSPANFPLTNLGVGTYDVTVVQAGGRVLLSSVGTVNGVSRTVAAEVKDLTPTSLFYMMSSGSDFRLRAFLLGLVDINGNIHSNNDMRLQANVLALLTIDPCGAACCTGQASASGSVTIKEGFWASVDIADPPPIDDAAPVTFPNFDYAYYQSLASAGNPEDYQAGDKTWENVTLTPANGIVYVEGTVTFRGVCHLNGGIVADKIIVRGELHQHKTGTRNVIISRSDDIEVLYRITVEEALVYSGRDFRALGAGAVIEVAGTLIAARYLRIWDLFTFVTYNHRLIYPDGMVIGVGGVPFEVVSWNL